MQSIFIDLVQYKKPKNLHVKHGDSLSRFFKIVLTEDNNPRQLQDGETTKLSYSVGDQKGSYSTIDGHNAVNVSGNSYTCEITEEATHGNGDICLTIEGQNGYKISTWNIPIESEWTPYEGGMC